MFDFSNPETFWLNITNLALGGVVVLAIIALGVSTMRTVLENLRERRLLHGLQDSHTLDLSGLGITMADGGEPLKGKSKEKPASHR